MCHHYLAAQSLAEDFVFEYSLSGASRAAVERLAAELANASVWPLKTVPALRIDDSGELVAFGAEWGLLPPLVEADPRCDRSWRRPSSFTS